MNAHDCYDNTPVVSDEERAALYAAWVAEVKAEGLLDAAKAAREAEALRDWCGCFNDRVVEGRGLCAACLEREAELDADEDAGPAEPALCACEQAPVVEGATQCASCLRIATQLRGWARRTWLSDLGGS